MSNRSVPTENQWYISSRAGDARAGGLEIGNTAIDTPNLFPIVNFYAGGMERSLFGGGPFRTIKEFISGSREVYSGDYQKYFDGAMMSVASLTDYGISKERFEEYTEKPIKQRDIFQEFDGALFIDSGGFKFLGGGTLDGSNFEVEVEQKSILNIQRDLGGDLLVNLDRPIEKDDSFDRRVEKAEQTAKNIEEFLERSRGTSRGRYLTLHGYNYSMQDTFLQQVEQKIGKDRIKREFDGVALGSLVPIKDNKDKLITAVSDCRDLLRDRGMGEFPLHVLGISSSAIPLLIAVGADTFDSSSYMHQAINGKYSTSILSSVHISDADFSKCDCEVCSSDQLVSQMRGDVEYKKDQVGPVAMHNLIIQKREIKAIQEAIHHSGTEALVSYIDETFGHKKSMRQHAHRVVNESLGGYF